MDIKHIELLEKNGWTVECESPFEIRHKETNSFASGLGAESVLYGLKGLRLENVKIKKCYCGNPIDTSNSDCVDYNLCKDHAMDC